MARLTAGGRRNTRAPALPVAYPQLAKMGFRPRQGQLSLTVAGTGVGKSQLWQNLAHRMKVPTLYWSADTDEHDVRLRALALLSSKTTDQLEHDLRDQAWASYYEDLLHRSAHIEWVFDPAITPAHLTERMKSFATVRGLYPRLLVVDNLSNTVEHIADEQAEQKGFMVSAQKLARDSRAHVAVLAHVKGEYGKGDRPVPLNGVLNNIDKLPEVVLTMHRATEDGRTLGLNLVKNRGGKADPGAQHALQVDVDFARGTVHGFEVAA